ncbi:hypothetical protein GGR55DRAFT_677409 [Xylaria sp. FL0064]|nr:hypothetical protein GGR55DRAFT_677409 [Xylaria sp. FL0064]
MSLVLASVGRLKAEVRLEQSIERFQSVLSTEQRAAFHAGRDLASQSCPQVHHVMQVTAEIERQARVSSGGGRRCFGPRITKGLQSIQEFVSVGDILIGGSQNLIAASVWSLVRLSLLTAARLSTYLQKLSELLMVVGRSAPRYQEMATLHPRSKALQRLGIEYEFDLSAHQSKLFERAEATKDQLGLEEAKENSRARDILHKFSSGEALRQKLSGRAVLLDACSTFDYQMAWKQARKCGDATYFLHDEEYIRWKSSTAVSTISVSGKLGAGKTVVLANIIDDILLATKSHAVAYFFCRSDHVDSQKGRTIVGCLARQILEALPLDDIDKLSSELQPRFPLGNIKQLFNSNIFKVKHIFVILDGIDECDEHDRSHVIEFLRQLQGCCQLKVCVSYRLTADLRIRNELAALSPEGAIQMPEENPDIISFIQAKLESCIETGKLTLGDPTLILEISQALEVGVQGMFLWVVLQIETICAQKTDSKIREALRCLSKDLPDTFTRILTTAEVMSEPEYQKRLLKLILAAVRPLTTDELREALSVTPFVPTWNPSERINDIQVALSAGGSLLIVDEEKFSVHFVHPSVKQFLLGGLGSNHNFHVDRSLADLEMAQVVLTYLSYNVFDKQVTRISQTRKVTDRQLYDNIVSSTLTSSWARSMALNLLRTRRQNDFDVGKALSNFKPTTLKSSDMFSFYQYASENWLIHTKFIQSGDARLLFMIRKVIRKELGIGRRPLTTELNQRLGSPHETLFGIKPVYIYTYIPFARSHMFFWRLYPMSEPLIWAIENSHLGIFRTMIRKSIRNIVSVIAYSKIAHRIQARFFPLASILNPTVAKFSTLEAQIYAKILCLLAILGDCDICNDFLRHSSSPIRLTKMLEAIPLVPLNALAIALVLVQLQATHGFVQRKLISARKFRVIRNLEGQIDNLRAVILHANEEVMLMSDKKDLKDGEVKVFRRQDPSVFHIPWDYLRPLNDPSKKQFSTCCDTHVGVAVGHAALCACYVSPKYRQIVGQLGDLDLKEETPRSNWRKSYWGSIHDEDDHV